MGGILMNSAEECRMMRDESVALMVEMGCPASAQAAFFKNSKNYRFTRIFNKVSSTHKNILKTNICKIYGFLVCLL